jgi:CRISPR-associated endonuclease Csn1
MASLEFQRFRMLQSINNLDIICVEDGLVRPLTQGERGGLIAELETKSDITFARARKVLGLPKSSYAFNLEEGGEKKLIGNKTGGALAKIFGARWEDLSHTQREAVVEDLHSIQKDETLNRRGMEAWGLDQDGAEALSIVRLEDGYCSLSRKALRKILPELEKGRRYGEIVNELYPKPQRPALDYLPGVDRTDIVVRNPAVHRALTELRKVVNGIVREHAKPDKIRIELARDLRQPRQERKRRSDSMRKNQAARDDARRRILEEMGDPSPSRTDILKVQLADECNWQCPYTGLQISWSKLLGSEPRFDIEHIIPYHRSLDDSFVNKTLCEVAENRTVKKNRTPFEAYGWTDRWEDILERVKAFNGRPKIVAEKLRRFRLEDLSEFEDFSSRLLNDTRYVSTLAADYLALLYGGLSDTEGVRRIQATKGGITAQLRNAWKLNGLLSEGPGKSREDHRHHAVDAIVVALTDPGMIKRLSNAAERCFERGRRRWWNYVELPWEGFLEEAKQVIDSIIVSHRVSRRVTGPLHDETYYAHKPGSQYVHVRKPLGSLSSGEVAEIVDDRVRECVQDILGDGDPKKVFASAEDHPALHARDGREIPIHRVRIRKSGKPETIGKGVRERHVLTGSNHHVEIVAVNDKKGAVHWRGHVVTTLEAMRRLKAGDRIVKRDHGEEHRFLFSLALNEVVGMRHEDGHIGLYKVTTISEFTNGTVQLTFVDNTDARLVTKISRKGRTKTPDKMRQAGCEKLAVTPLGEVRRAND